MDIIVSDFDGTLFKRNYGLIGPAVDYLEERGLPVFIVTYRDDDQRDFIESTLGGTKLEIIGYGFVGSRKKESYKKIELINYLATKYNIKEVLDDDETVVVGLRKQGFQARRA